MNRKQKKELRQRQSTRQLMGIVRVTPHGIVTDSGERVFFLIQPDNLSVLSPEVLLIHKPGTALQAIIPWQ